MTIDWSKAPKRSTGAMVANFSSALVKPGDVEFIGAPGQVDRDIYHEGPDAWTFHVRPELVTAWDGKGLPPVGSVCECRVVANGEWMMCEVVAHKNHDGNVYAIAFVDENTVMLSAGIRFRTIRTPEQIAAEEREAAIQDLIKVTCITHGEAARIHDAGYRKQVAQ